MLWVLHAGWRTEVLVNDFPVNIIQVQPHPRNERIFDINGNNKIVNNINAISGMFEIVVDTSTWTEGYYVYIVTDGDKIVDTKSIVIAH